MRILNTFYTYFGRVPDAFQKSCEGQICSFSNKFWVPLGYVLASSLVSKERSKNTKKSKKCPSQKLQNHMRSK